MGSESKRIRRLVDDLLWLARLDTPQGRPAAEPVEVGVVVHQAAERFAAVAESRGMRLQVSVGLGPLVILGSSEWLDRLLGVLLDNAFKYAPQGGIVAVSVGVDGNRIRLVVEDSGLGFRTMNAPRSSIASIAPKRKVGMDPASGWPSRMPSSATATAAGR